MKTYAEFWPFYLLEHSNPKNRMVHYFGTSLTFLVIAAAILFSNAWILIGMPLCGYGFAWYGHFIVQKNRPATFKHPFWSLISDYRMYFLFITGKLEPHLKKAGVR